MGNNNIYNYKTPKSGNEETGFFNIKGRINRKSFILRWLFSCGLFVIFTWFYYNGFFSEYDSRSFIFFETIYFYILPLYISIFNLIQGAKRMHDVNKSGWYFFVPLYNLYLIFSAGTKGNNDYGIDPTPSANIQFFDELETTVNNENQVSNAEEKKSGLDKWQEHLNQVRKQNPNKTYQEVLEIARNTYSKNNPNNKQSTPKKKSSKSYLIFFVLVVIAVYYFKFYEPQHRDSDGDGIADVMDDCPNEIGFSSVTTYGCPDMDGDGVADKNDDCPEKLGNESDGCYYFKKVTFNNNSRNKAYLSIAYKHKDEWICEGWYSISSGASYTFDLPKYFKGKEVFWYAKDENGAEWTGTYRYFYIATGGSAGFEVRNGRFKEKGGGRAIKKGFYKLDLTNENTSQSLAD